MSSWTYITGVITVSPMGRTQPEKRYILDTILSSWKWRELIISNPKPYEQMAEFPSWFPEKSNGEPMWCEYLMWDRAKDINYPMLLAYKYYNDPENDAEVERRMDYAKGE